MLFTTASAGVLSKCPKQGLTLESTGSLARSHTQNCIVLGKDSHPSLHILDKVSQPSPQWLGNDSHTHMYGPWARTQTRARSAGLKPEQVSNPSLQISDKDLAWARMVLGKDLHSSRQGPRQGLAPEPAAS